MGHIYYRQEKYGMAEYHFRRALSINHRSSVLRCYLGMALHKLKRSPEALDMLGQVGAALSGCCGWAVWLAAGLEDEGRGIKGVGRLPARGEGVVAGLHRPPAWSG